MNTELTVLFPQKTTQQKNGHPKKTATIHYFQDLATIHSKMFSFIAMRPFTPVDLAESHGSHGVPVGRLGAIGAPIAEALRQDVHGHLHAVDGCVGHEPWPIQRPMISKAL